MSTEMSRRSTMLSLAAAPLAAYAAGDRITVGLSTNDFRDHTNASLAAELKSQNVKVIQLFFTQKDSNYWRYGERSNLSGLSVARAREIADTYRSAGISIQALGVYLTLVHGDAAERKANLAIRFGDEVGAPDGDRHVPERDGPLAPAR